MFKKYRAYATISYDLVCEFEVEDDQDAWEVARNLDGGDFKEIDNSSDWRVFEVQPVMTDDEKIMFIKQINREAQNV